MGRPGKKSERLAKLAMSSPSLLAGGGDLLRFDPDRPEKSYAEIAPLSHRKRFGQFFTPASIAAMMAEWACAKHPRTVLDPAVGPGIFVREVLGREPGARVTAIDADEFVLEALRRTPAVAGGDVHPECADFLTWEAQHGFDAILANPPYLRHHDLAYDFDVFKEIGRRNEVRLSRLTNSYGLFMLEACRRLNPGGRAAIIVPGEWTNSNFGLPLKQFLLRGGLLRYFVYFSHAELIFEDALTTACVLLIEKRPEEADTPMAVETRFLEGFAASPSLGELIEPGDAAGIVARRFAPDVLGQAPKWDFLLRSGAPERGSGYVELGRLAATRRGIATGANEFFHLTPGRAAALGLSGRHLRPCIGRAADVPSFIFGRADWERLVASDRRSYLVDFSSDLGPADRSYIEAGEAEGIHERYLLAARSPWYRMEEREPSPIWAAVFGRGGLRFVLNDAGIHNLTTFHCIYPKASRPDFAAALVGCLNSRPIQEKARAQNRVYGGGLRKFEPRDLLDIMVPDLTAVPDRTLARIADATRRLDRAARGSVDAAIRVALDDLDREVLDAASEAATVSRKGPSGSDLRQGSLFLRLG